MDINLENEDKHGFDDNANFSKTEDKTDNFANKPLSPIDNKNKLKCIFPFATCSKEFKQNASVQCHIVTVHSKEREFQCTFCPKEFSGKRPLKAHVQTIHNKENTFLCPPCSKQYNQKSNLKTHIATIHNKGKPFICTFCINVFYLKNNLKTDYARQTNPVSLPNMFQNFKWKIQFKKSHCASTHQSSLFFSAHFVARNLPPMVT